MVSAKKIITGGKPTTPGIVDVKPVGATILVEMLNADEALGTKLYISEKTAVGAPQGYILAIGPNLSKECGLNPGDRVLLQGKFVPVPEFDGSQRARGIVEFHDIKAVLVEGK